MAKRAANLTQRVAKSLGVLVLLASTISCLGMGKDQLHGMYDLSFPSTAVCNAQEKLITFRNVSESEIVIEGVAISMGTDPNGNFNLESVIIGAEEIPSVFGQLQDIHIPSGALYSFKVSYAPKVEQASDQAILDIVYTQPEQGVIQITLQGIAGGSTPECSSEPVVDEPKTCIEDATLCSATQKCENSVCVCDPLKTTCEAPVTCTQDPTLCSATQKCENSVCVCDPLKTACEPAPEDGEERLLTVESLVAATSELATPIDTGQGKFEFAPIDLGVKLDGPGKKITIHTYTASDFILPPPQVNTPLDGIVLGSIGVTITSEKIGFYDPATGEITVDGVEIHMDGAQDFSADLTIKLTTGRIARSSLSHPVNTSALNGFGKTHWDSVKKEVFGTPLNATTGKIYLVGMSALKNVQLKPTAKPELDKLDVATMAVLIEGTLKPK